MSYAVLRCGFFTKTAVLSVIVALPATQALAVDEHFVNESAVIDGYDAVAYHTVGDR